MGNNFKNDAQRLRWNDYNREYRRRNYTSYTLRVSKTKDKDIIDFIEAQDDDNFNVLCKRLFRSFIDKK